MQYHSIEARDKYVQQSFLESLGKLSNNGWSIHQRVVQLDDFYLSYYKNVPKNFKTEKKLIDLKPNNPKQKIFLHRIKFIGVIDPGDKKKYKKLKTKGSDDIYLKVVFYLDALVKGSSVTTTDVNEKDSDDAQGEDENPTSDVENSNKDSKLNEKSKPVKIWYFNCETFEMRDELIAKIYINTKNRMEVILGGQQKFAQSEEFKNLNYDDNILTVLQKYVEDQEKMGQQIILNKAKLRKSDDYKSEASEIVNQQTEKNESQIHSDNDQDSDTDQNQYQMSNMKSEIQMPKVNDIDMSIDQKSLQKFAQKKTQDETIKEKVEDPQTILQQNININNQLKDAKSALKGFFGNQVRQKVISEADIKIIRDKIEQYNSEEQMLENYQTEKESKGWDLKFQNYWGYIIAADKQFDQSLNMCEKLFKHVGMFRAHATNHFKKIIDQIHDPLFRNDKEKGLIPIPIQNISIDQAVYMDEEDDSLYFQKQNVNPKEIYSLQGQSIYIYDNIIFKVTHPNELVYAIADGSNQKGNDAISNIYNQSKYPVSDDRQTIRTTFEPNTSQRGNQMLGISKVQKWKLFGKQFLSMDVMFDALFLLSKHDSKHKIRIPLSALIDYKGFRCLAIGKIPILPQQGPSIGFHNGQYEPQQAELKNTFANVGEVLHLKDNHVASSQNQMTEPAPVSFFTKIYQFSQTQENELKKHQNEPSKQSLQYHFNELDYMDEDVIYYVLKTMEIFPLDFEIGDNKIIQKQLQNVFRPEFTCSYDQYLQADTQKNYININVGLTNFNDGQILGQEGKQKNLSKDIIDISDASKFLKSQIIQQLVNKLDDLEILPIDSENLNTIMHQHGINMRYLSHICVLTQVPHVKDICVIEMLARTCKNIINTKMSELILENKIEFNLLSDKKNEKQKQIEIQKKYIESQNSKLKKGQNVNNILDLQNNINEYDPEESNQAYQTLKQEKDKIQKLIQKKEKKDMDRKTRKFIVDMLNLIFGKGDETTYFWDFILFKQCSEQFALDEAIKYHEYLDGKDEILNKERINLNALFFAVIYNVGIKINPFEGDEPDETNQSRKNSQKYQNEYQERFSQYFRKFGKDERPFGDPRQVYYKFEIVPRSKTYGLRNIPYREISDRNHKFVKEQQIEEALQCQQMKKLIKFSLSGNIDLITLAEIAELAIDQGQNEIAIKFAEEAIQNIYPLHSERVRFYCILLRAHFNLNNFQEFEIFFKLISGTITHHLGPSHPLHITVCGIKAYLLVPKGKMEEAEYIYKSAMMCCLKSLGPNHIQTAQLHMDFGQFYLKWDQRDKALSHFEQAFMIYDHYFDHKQQIHNIEVIADAAMQVANILEEQNRLVEAFDYVQIAYEKYDQVYGDSSDNTIISLWLKLQIAYNLSKQKDNQVIEMADKLFHSLVQRDLKLINRIAEEQYGEEAILNTRIEFVDELKHEMDKIKILCIVTHVMEITRMLSDDKKRDLGSFCDKLMLKKFDKEQKQSDQSNFRALKDYQKNHTDLLIIKKVSNIQLKEDDEEFLHKLYKTNKSSGFKEFYFNMVDQAINQEKTQKDNQKALTITSNNEKLKKIAGISGSSGQDISHQKLMNIVGVGLKSLAQKTQIPMKIQQDIDILEEEAQRDEIQLFFDQLLDAFNSINFYNLLEWHGPKH